MAAEIVGGLWLGSVALIADGLHMSTHAGALRVNLLSAFLLRDEHEHTSAVEAQHAHEHPHDHLSRFQRDHNLRAAFAHVVADAAVSVLVIVGLVAGRQFGCLFMDPLMGLVGTGVILSWAWTLIRSSGAVLLDAAPGPDLSRRIVSRLEHGGDRVSDLHVWRVGPGISPQ